MFNACLSVCECAWGCFNRYRFHSVYKLLLVVQFSVIINVNTEIPLPEWFSFHGLSMTVKNFLGPNKDFSLCQQTFLLQFYNNVALNTYIWKKLSRSLFSFIIYSANLLVLVVIMFTLWQIRIHKLLLWEHLLPLALEHFENEADIIDQLPTESNQWFL